MAEATGYGGIMVFHGKVLLFYKNYKNRCEDWVFPKGTAEADESFEITMLHEVKEEAGVSAHIAEYIGKSEYTFNARAGQVNRSVHWYLMSAESYYSKLQREEFFMDSGYYKYHEAWHLLKFANEKVALEKAYTCYQE